MHPDHPECCRVREHWAENTPFAGAQALETKQLQKEAAQRLNVMIDELRNSQNADLSAKNLGDEGCGYIAEGLAFNDRCAQGCPLPWRTQGVC